MPYYAKKAVVIFAEEILEPIDIETLEGTMRGNPGDMLITGIQGEKYPCKRDIFEATYYDVTKDVYDDYISRKDS